MREDPLPEESVVLVVELVERGEGAPREDQYAREAREAQEARMAVEDLVAAHDGQVLGDLRFADLAVEVPQSAVAALCDLDGIARIETGDTLTLGLQRDEK